MAAGGLQQNEADNPHEREEEHLEIPLCETDQFGFATTYLGDNAIGCWRSQLVAKGVERQPLLTQGERKKNGKVGRHNHDPVKGIE